MPELIETRLWLPAARNLPVGYSDKIVHKGCGVRPSLHIQNDADRYWCYCHRCRHSGFSVKEVQRVRQKLCPKTGWVPNKIIPMVEAIVSEPYNFKELFERYELAKYVSLLKFSPDTRRVYFPDDSGSLLGLDATFQANARFYSPYKRAMASRLRSDSALLVVTGSLQDYLSNVVAGNSVILAMNRAGEKAALAVVSELYKTQHVVASRNSRLREEFMLDLRPFMRGD